MHSLFVIVILIMQLNYFYLFPTPTLHQSNLKKAPKIKNEKEKERRLDDLSYDIVIIHLNDVHCGFNETIGYDGFVLYRDYLKTKYKNVITVDVGDHSQGGVLGAITDGEAVIEIMNKVGFDVVTIGNHEFDYGVEQLHKLNSLTSTKYISLNVCYKKNKTKLFEPSKIIEVGNKKIGFIGLVTPLAFSKTYLSNLKESDGSPIYNLFSDKEEMYTAIQEEADDLKNNKKVDYVILLTHVGMNKEEYTSNEILSKVQNIDAVFDGHTHDAYNTTSKDKSNKDIPITQTGTKLAHIGQLIIKQDGKLLTENIAKVPEPTDKTDATEIKRGGDNRWVDKNMNEFINQIYEKYASELNIIYGHSDFDFNITSSDENAPHQVKCRYQECTLGNLLSDAFVNVTSANLSIVNGGNVRTNLLKGDITRKQLIDVSPFFNSIFVKEVTGEAILNALEFGVSNLPKAFGGFPQVSGCTYYVNTSINSTVEKDANGMFIKVGGDRWVSNVKINGKPLNLSQKYNLSSSEFILGGGDGYSMFGEFPIVNESIFADSDVLGYYIKNDLKGEIPSKYQELQNRINLDKEPDDDKEINRITLLSEYLKNNLIFLFLSLFLLM